MLTYNMILNRRRGRKNSTCHLFFLFLCMCGTCLWVCSFVFEHVCGVEKLTLGITLGSSPSSFLRHGLLLIMEFTNHVDELASRLQEFSCLHSLLRSMAMPFVDDHTDLSHTCSVSKLRSSCPWSKRFTQFPVS